MISSFKLFIFFFNCLLLITGCNDNPTASRDLTWIAGHRSDGLDKLKEISGIILLSPPTTPNINATPRIRIIGFNSKDRVSIYKDSQCSNLLTSQKSNSTELELTLPTLPVGTYTLHAKRRWEFNNIESNCSTVFLNYEVRNPLLTGPQINWMMSPAVSTYNVNQDLNFTITFDENVIVTGRPRLSLMVGSTPRYASYSNGNGSKTLTFTYDTQSGDWDSDGMSFVNTMIDLNNGSLKNTLGNNAVLNFSSVIPSLSNVNVDAVIPVVSNLNNDETYRKTKNWSWGCSKTPCTYRFIIDTLSSTNPGGTYTTASTGSQTIGTDMYYIHVQAKDSAGNESNVKHVYARIDNRGPEINAMTPPAVSTYNINQDLDFTITFDENVVVTGVPRLAFTVGSTPRYASYSRGNGSTALTFTYDTQSGDSDSNGLAFVNTMIDLNNGYLKDASGNNAVLNFSAVAPSLSSINIDAVIPVVTGLNNDDTYKKAKDWSWGCSETPCTYRFVIDTSPSTNPTGTYAPTNTANQISGTDMYYIHVQAKDLAGNESNVKHVYAQLDNTGPQIDSMTSPRPRTYNLNQDLNFTITFDENVVVTDTPRLSLTVGLSTRYASYSNGNDSTTLTFTYDTQSGDLDSNGISFVNTMIDLNNGYIKDSLGNNAVLNFSAVPPSLSNVNVDAVIPVVTGLTNDDTPAQTKNWSWGCSETPCTYRSVIDTLSSTNPGGAYTATNTANQTSGTGTYYIHIQAKDSAGNESNVKHVYANLDNTGPQINSMTAPNMGTYNLNQDLDFTITFDKSVVVTGIPRLSLTVGLSTRYASYSSGDTSTTLTFTYDTQSGDLDSNGLAFVNTMIDLNNGSIKDASGNDSVLNFSSEAPTLNGVNVEAVIPIVTGLTNDDTSAKTKNWSWGCSETPCTYRSVIDTSPSTNPTGTYAAKNTGLQTGGTDMYYIHVQAKDSAGNESNVKHVYARLDNTGPQMNSMTAPSPGTYNLNQDLNFTITFDENVVVTGTPRLSLTVGLSTRYASYSSGDTSTVLTFTYDTQSGDLDSNGLSFANTMINLNNGSIKDSLGNNAVLNFSGVAPDLSNVNVDAVIPIVTGLSNDDTSAQTKNWSWGCSKTPCTYRSVIDTSSSTNPGGNYTATNTANQTSGTGTYYIHVQAKDSAGNESNVKHVYARLDNMGPQIDSMTSPGPGTYNLNQDLDFTITFDKSVVVTGNPRLSLTVGSSTRYASYSSGDTSTTLTFTYDTQSGDLDSNGLVFVNTMIDLNNGSIKDASGNDSVLNFSSTTPTLNGINVDAVIPVVTGLSNDDTSAKTKNWSWGCSETPCTYRSVINTSPSTNPGENYTATKTANQTSGTETYYIHVQAKDSAGNESNVKHVYAQLDNTGPQINSMTSPSPGTYNLSQDLNFTITFDKSVVVTDTPRLSLTVGSSTRYASYSSGDTSTTLTFTYDTQSDDLDSNGLAFVNTMIDLNNGSIKDSLGNDSVLNFSSEAPTLNGINVDAVIPVVTGLSNDDTSAQTKNWSWQCSKTPCTYRSTIDTSSSTNPGGNYTATNTANQTSGTGTYYIHVQAKDSAGNESNVKHVYARLDNMGPQIDSMTSPGPGTYNLNQDLNFTITFDKSVVVTGNPRLSLTVGSSTRYASYSSGDTSTTLTFTYDTQSGDLDSNGLVFVNTMIDLNNGSIKDASGNDSVLNFSSTTPTLNGINVDAVIPVVTGLTNDDTSAKTKNWSWGCSETPCTYRSVINTSPSTNPGGNYTATKTANQTSGTETYYIHVQAKDSAGNESNVKHVYAQLDNTGPQINSMTSPSQGTYNLNQDLNFTITFDENVVVTSTPRLSLTVGSSTRYASYSSGDTSTTLTFTYDTQSGDLDSNGLVFVNTMIDLNNGSIKDASGNDSVLNFSSTAPTLNGINVDAVIPIVTGLSNDNTSAQTKNWSWGCSETPCTYRSVINTLSSTNPGGNYTATKTANQTSGTGTYYIHVQAKDSAGNESNVKHVYARLDNTGPQIDSMTSPSPGTYNLNQDLNFTITFDESVVVTDTPRLSLTVGSSTRYASYSSGDTSTTLTFTYDTQSGDLDSNGLSFVNTMINLNNGSIKDSLGNNAVLNFSGGAPNLSNINVDAVIPVLTGLSNDDTYTQTKNWSWGCSETPCTYRSVIDTSPSTNPGGNYTATNTANQTSGTGTYYIHVQAKDSAGNESDVKHVYAKIDNSSPIITGTSDVTQNDATNILAVTINWSTLTVLDNHSGLDRIEIAVGNDADSSSSLEVSELDNIVSWGQIPNALSLSPKEYQIVNGTDGFIINLSSKTNYQTSLKFVDSSGNATIITSEIWQTQDIPLWFTSLEIWLDGKSSDTLFLNNTCSSSTPTNGDTIGCWADKSGNNNDAIQSDSADRPILRSGGNLEFSSAKSLNAGNVLSGTYTELSMFLLDTTIATGYNYTFSLNHPNNGCSNGRVLAHLPWDDGKIYWDYGGCGNGRRLGSPVNIVTNNTAYIYQFLNSETDGVQAVWQNGVLLASDGSHSVTISGTTRIGEGGNQWSSSSVFQLGEVLIFSNYLSSGDRQIIEGYLACQWNLQSELPALHPYETNCP